MNKQNAFDLLDQLDMITVKFYAGQLLDNMLLPTALNQRSSIAKKKGDVKSVLEYDLALHLFKRTK